MSNVVAINPAHKRETTPAPRFPPLHRYRRALTSAAAHYWRIMRIVAEVHGWLLFAGLALATVS